MGRKKSFSNWNHKRCHKLAECTFSTEMKRESLGLKSRPRCRFVTFPKLTLSIIFNINNLLLGPLTALSVLKTYLSCSSFISKNLEFLDFNFFFHLVHFLFNQLKNLAKEKSKNSATFLISMMSFLWIVR